MAAKPKPSLLDDVRSRVVNTKPGFRCWWERLPPDVLAELEAVRADFNPAVDQKRAYALAVITSLQERGYQVAGEESVIKWLVAKR